MTGVVARQEPSTVKHATDHDAYLEKLKAQLDGWNAELCMT
jgi:hypothetical protein